MLSQTAVKCAVNILVIFLVAFAYEMQPLLLEKQHTSLVSVGTFKYWNL
jgi:hypothetical protein